MIPANSMLRARVLVPALLGGLTQIASAQLVNASPAAAGLSGAYTARARGYNALAWNPANLGMPGNPGFSFTIAAFDGTSGLKPIDVNKIGTYSGKYIPASVREQWLTDVTAQGGQKGALGSGLTEFAMSVGPLAFQLNTKVATNMTLAPDAIEAMLFGNTGRTGTPKTLNLAGTEFQGSAYSTAAVGFGLPLARFVPLSNFAAGMTVKYTVAHGLIIGQDNASTIAPDDIRPAFVGLFPDSTVSGAYEDGDIMGGNVGKGIGIDLGAAWTIPGFRFGVSLQNVTNSFKFDTTKLATRGFTAQFNSSGNSSQSDSIDKPYANAPASLRAKVAGLKFKPVLAAGVAFDWLPKMTVSADVRQQAGDGIEVGPKSMVSGGVEYRIIPFVPLRAGASLMSGGVGVSGGVGLHLLGYEAAVGAYLRKVDGGSEPGFTLNIFSIRP